MDASHVPPLGAPGDSPGGASSTSSAPSATSPANETSTSTLPGNTAAALASGHPSATRRLVPAARPGVLFQNRILSECFSLVASPPLVHPRPANSGLHAIPEMSATLLLSPTCSISASLLLLIVFLSLSPLPISSSRVLLPRTLQTSFSSAELRNWLRLASGFMPPSLRLLPPLAGFRCWSRMVCPACSLLLWGPRQLLLLPLPVGLNPPRIFLQPLCK